MKPWAGSSPGSSTPVCVRMSPSILSADRERGAGRVYAETEMDRRLREVDQQILAERREAPACDVLPLHLPPAGI